MDLSGRWRAQVADEHLSREFSRPELDDESWPEIAVPGHWRSAPPFADTDGPLLYRRRFEGSIPADGRRSWLVLEGLFYLGDVWLDGSYVGDTEGYFFPHAFEVTDLLRGRAEHLLAVEVGCSRPTDRAAKRNLTGVFQHWDCLDPDWNPGGIWRPVTIEESGPVRITRLVTVCPEATDERAVLSLRATLDAAETTRVILRTTVGGSEHQIEQPLAAGENQVTWNVTVDHPRLWWPHSLGDQPLESVTIEVIDRDGTTSDARSFRTGLRQVSMSKWVLSVNGERLFLKGSNQGPTRMALGEATPDELARDVHLAKDAGLDLLRIHAHISRPELYDAADDAGLLLWQDMPLQWGYARGVRKQAVRQAAEAVRMLGHHPSVAIWCGHNEPMAIDLEPGVPFSDARIAARMAVAQQLPSWNKTVLDHSIKRGLEQADGSRPVIPHSGVFPHPGSGGTDTHTYFGWYHGEERDFPRAMATWPRLARFVTEFGAQAVPDADEFMEPERWPELDWDRLWRTHALQRFAFDRYVPPDDYGTFHEWKAATQRYQSTVIKHHIETLRRLKYRPTGGFCQFSFADAHPSVTWSVLDHTRAPKQGFTALRDACRPVIVVADRPRERYAPGEAIALDVHIVNDLRKPVRGQVRAQLQWTGGSQEWRWEGEVPEDDCVRVGTVQAVTPDAPGPLTLTLALVGEAAVANRYDALIAGRNESA